MLIAVRKAPVGGTRADLRGQVLRYSGTLTGVCCGVALGALLSAGALSSQSAIDPARFFGSALPFGTGGLLLDLLRRRFPALWRSERPSQLRGSLAAKVVLYWVIAYPFAILWYFAIVGIAARYLADPVSLVSFLAYQAFIGSAFGAGFAYLEVRLARLLRGPSAGCPPSRARPGKHGTRRDGRSRAHL